MRLARVCAHFHGLAGSPQLGNEHRGIELIESGGWISLHNQDWRRILPIFSRVRS